MDTQIQTQTQVQNQVIRLPEVLNMVGLKRASVYVLMKEGNFPRPIKLGMYANGWLVAELQSWINERIRERNEQEMGGR